MNNRFSMGFCLLLLSMEFPAPAAIITERNDYCDWKYDDNSWGNKTGCFPPPAYTFVGTSSRPGIDSCWIPYGTYTDGTGGTEYTRVTSNLMGVVASALGGAKERWSAFGGLAYVDGPAGSETTDEYADMYGAPILRPMDWDGTIHVELEEYLASTTNLSLRISDQLNRGIILCQDDVIYDSNIALEPLLACTRAVIDYQGGWYTNFFFNGGILGRFGSCRLEEMLGSVPPPISTSWSPQIPFDITKFNDWDNVWPVFSACTNDIHFFPAVEAEYRYLRVLPRCCDEWGDDVWEARTNLWHVLSQTPYNITVEDVLSADTGWGYNLEPKETNSYWTVNYRDVVSGEPVYRAVRLSKGGEGVWYGNPPPGGTIKFIQIGYSENNIYFYASGNFDEKNYESEEDRDAASNIVFVTDYGYFYAVKTLLYDDSDDYRHWRNMTTRLDWKRLGIICQLERQMEITYEHEPYSPWLPAVVVNTTHVYIYDDTVTIDLPTPELGHETTYSVRALKPSWTKYDESRSISSNYFGNFHPTCRLPAPTVGGNATIIGTNLMRTLKIDEETIEDMMTKFAESASLSNGVHNIVLTGHWTPVDALSVRYRADSASEWDWVDHPSNTVTATINGQSYSKTGSYPIAGSFWGISQQNPLLSVAFPPQGGTTIRLSLRSGGEELEVYEMSFEGDLDNGSCMIPAISLTASGDGDFTNWVWQADGGEFTYIGMSIEPDGVSWDWEDDQGYALWLWYMFDDTQGFGNEACYDASHMYWYKTNIDGHPQYISSPQGSVEWESRTSRQWEVVETWTSGIPDYRVGFEYDITNEDVRITLDIYKSARGLWTYSEEDTFYRWDDRICYQEFPTVQGLLYERGPQSGAGSQEAAPLYWNDIDDHGGTGRVFRLSPRSSDRAQTKSQAVFVRNEIIRSLDEACKDKCVELGGPDPRVISEFGKLTGEDTSLVMEEVKYADITAQYVINSSETNSFVVSAIVDVHDGGSGVPEITVSDCRAGYGEAFAPPAYVCDYGWTFSTADVATTNVNDDVRADGSQAQIKRTLWKFKNLRDPNL